MSNDNIHTIQVRDMRYYGASRLDSGRPEPRRAHSHCIMCGDEVRVFSCGDVVCRSCRREFHPGYGSPYYVADADSNGCWANIVKATESA